MYMVTQPICGQAGTKARVGLTSEPLLPDIFGLGLRRNGPGEPLLPPGTALGLRWGQ